MFPEEALDDGVDLIRHVRVGVVPRALEPHQGVPVSSDQRRLYPVSSGPPGPVPRTAEGRDSPLCTADQPPSALRQSPKPVPRQGAEFPFAVTVHHLLHQRLPLGCLRAPSGSGFPQYAPGVTAVEQLAAPQCPELCRRDIPPLKRGGINGDKSPGLSGESLHKALRQIPSHGLTDQYRPSHPLPNQDPVEPLCLFHQGEIQGKWAGGPVARCVPHQQGPGGMQKRRTASGTAGDPPSGPAERPARSREGRARSPSIGWSPVSSDSSAPTSPFPSLFSPPQREHAHGPSVPAWAQRGRASSQFR